MNEILNLHEIGVKGAALLSPRQRERQHTMRIEVGQDRWVVLVLGPLDPRTATRLKLRKESPSSADGGRIARELARKFKVDRSQVEVVDARASEAAT